MSNNNIYFHLQKTLDRLPKTTIEMNGGYISHYSGNPGQLIFGALSILSGIATGLLSVPSLMALRQLDHDDSNVAIFSQNPGLILMGACSAVAQINFLMSDLIVAHGRVYSHDHQMLLLLNNIYNDCLSRLDLVNFDEDDINNEALTNAIDRQIHKIALKIILDKITFKKRNTNKLPSDDGPWFKHLDFNQWHASLISRKVLSEEEDNTFYDKFVERRNIIWATYYQSINQAINDMATQTGEIITVSDREKTIDAQMVVIIKQALNENSEDSIFCDEIKKLYEPLLHDQDGEPIHDQTIIKQSKNLGVFLSYLNIFVNMLIGLGAFFALGQFIFWLGGGSLAIFTAVGILGWSIKIAFAGLCAIGSYLVTRHDIQAAFNRLGYQITLWWQNPDKWASLWATIKKPRNVFTVCATLPAAIGIAIINALGFYMAFQASPIVFALAIIVFISTMVAIMAMMGKRLYESYPRWCFYVNDLYKKRTPIMINGLIVSAVILGLSMSAYEIPLIMTFFAATPFSSCILMLCLATLLFACLMTGTNQWRWQVSLKGAIGTICVIASIIAVFVALLPITGPVFAIMIALTSSILFFSFYVSSIMVNEQDEKRYIVDLNIKTSHMSPTKLEDMTLFRPNDNENETSTWRDVNSETSQPMISPGSDL